MPEIQKDPAAALQAALAQITLADITVGSDGKVKIGDVALDEQITALKTVIRPDEPPTNGSSCNSGPNVGCGKGMARD